MDQKEITRSLYWIKQIARQKIAVTPGATNEDLVQEGLVGLLQAEQKYNSNKGAKLATYTSIRATGNIQDFVRKQNINNSRFITASDNHMLDNAIDEHESIEDTIAIRELQNKLIKAFFDLSDVHKKVLLLYYQQGKKQKTIAKQLGFSEARINQLLHSATNKLQRVI